MRKVEEATCYFRLPVNKRKLLDVFCILQQAGYNHKSRSFPVISRITYFKPRIKHHVHARLPGKAREIAFHTGISAHRTAAGQCQISVVSASVNQSLHNKVLYDSKLTISVGFLYFTTNRKPANWGKADKLKLYHACKWHV